MSSSPELPPKSLSVLNVLNNRRAALGTELATHCINDGFGCHDLARAKDLLRTYACLIFDTLITEYRSRVAIRDFEYQIAEEAIEIILACWDNLGVDPPAISWLPVLRNAITLHVGHDLNGSQANRDLRAPASAQTQDFRTIEKPTEPSFGRELKRLLVEARWRPEDVAEEIEIDPRNVYRHLSDRTAPTLMNVDLYERALSRRLKTKVRLPVSVNRRRCQ